VYVCIYIYIFVYRGVFFDCIYIQFGVYLELDLIAVYVYLYVNTHIYMYICIYIYTLRGPKYSARTAL